MQSEPLCQSHAASTGRQVESRSCAGPCQARGYVARPASLGAIHVHDNDDFIAMAVQPGCFHLQECLQKTFLLSRGTCRQEVALCLPDVRAHRQGFQQAGERAACDRPGPAKFGPAFAVRIPSADADDEHTFAVLGQTVFLRCPKHDGLRHKCVPRWRAAVPKSYAMLPGGKTTGL